MPFFKKVNWAGVIAVLTGLAGIAGSVITPIFGQQLASETANILQGLSAVLLVITGYHAQALAVAKAKAKFLAGAVRRARSAS